MGSPSQDPGPAVPWYMFFPDIRLVTIPPYVEDPVAYGRESGAAIVRRGNQIVWRRATDPACRPAQPASKTPTGIRRRGHLAVVK